jgi:ribosome recycling factor
MPDIFLDNLNREFDKAISHLKIELAKVHTGRASVGLIEDLNVDYYGTRTPLKALALITITAPREIKIEVWDQNAVKAVADALIKDSLGSMPQIEGQIIRINLPPMTTETRDKMAKIVHTLSEETKISLRSNREKIWSDIQKLEQDGNIREDKKFKLKEKIQELIDDYNKQIDELEEKKEKEIKS